jgi:hypothetical protein
MDLGLYQSSLEKDMIHDLAFGNETGVRKLGYMKSILSAETMHLNNFTTKNNRKCILE